MTLTFRVPLLPPSVNSCWRKRARGGFYLTREAEAFIQAVGYLAPKEPIHKFYGGKYEVRIVFRVQEKDFMRADLDNRLKIAIDALTKSGVISDDRYIVRIFAEKTSVPQRSDEATEYEIVGL